MTTQLILAAPGTPVVFAASGLGDVLWTPQNEALGRGRLSAVWDRGAGHLPNRYTWRATCRWVATPLANDSLRLWLVTASAAADPTTTDGTFTLGDAELTTESELIANCAWFGAVVATAVDKLFVASGLVDLYSRYVAIAGWNSSATKALTNTPADFSCSFTPQPYAIQAPS
jgi:hypothetical protein